MCNINIVALCCSPFCIMCWVVHVSGGGGQGLRQEKQLRLPVQGLGYLMMSQDLVQTSSRMTKKNKQNNMCFPSWALVAFRFGHFLVGFLCPCFSVFFSLFLCSLLLRCSEFLLFACLLIFFSLLFCLFAFLLLHCFLFFCFCRRHAVSRRRPLCSIRTYLHWILGRRTRRRNQKPGSALSSVWKILRASAVSMFSP